MKDHKTKRKAFLEEKKLLYNAYTKEENPKLKELRKEIYQKFVKNKGFVNSMEGFDPGDGYGV